VPCPCPALPCPYPALPLPCPVSNFPFATRVGTGGGSYTGNGNVFFFPFAARDRRRKLHRERAMCFFFLLLPGTRGGSYTGSFFSFCCQGQEEEVTQGAFFPFAARDKRRKLHREFFFLLLPGIGGGSYTGNFFFLLLPGTGGRSYTGNGYLKQDRTYTCGKHLSTCKSCFVDSNLGKLGKKR